MRTKLIVFRPIKHEKYLVLLLIFCIITVILWVEYFRIVGNLKENVKDLKVEKFSSNFSKRTIVILMWTNYYNVKGEALMGLLYRGREWDRSCCSSVEITVDRGRLEEAGAIVFFHYYDNLNLQDLPPTRRSDQLWILFSKESPAHSPFLWNFDNLFNLTMGYRRDSDIWSPYGDHVLRRKSLKSNEQIIIKNETLNDFVSGETKLLAGVVSHCNTSSKREILVERLKHDANITVDIFGRCGIKICPRLAKECDRNEVWEKISREYKFYLAAENSLCFDYITEKLWRSLKIGVVPVVYGGGNYSLVAPPNSFIDARDFKSPKELGDHLLKLGEMPVEYKKYFEWRRNYKVRVTEGWDGWCKLCRYLQDYKRFSRKTHHKLGDWWYYKPSNESGGSSQVVCSKSFWKL